MSESEPNTTDRSASDFGSDAMDTRTNSGGGLGRGLAGILGDALDTHRAPEVSALLGAEATVRPPRVREMVARLALGAVRDRFGAEAVLMARLDQGDPVALTTSAGPAWGSDEGARFEVHGRLWRTLVAARGQHHQVSLDSGASAWFCHQPGTAGSTAAAVVRTVPFNATDEALLARLVRSVVASMTHDAALIASWGLDATDESNDDETASATVTVDGRSETAGSVAAAALRHCAEHLTAPFVGTTEVDGQGLTLAVVDDGAGAPVIGVAVRPLGDPAGTAEAVLLGAHLLGAGPTV